MYFVIPSLMEAYWKVPWSLFTAQSQFPSCPPRTKLKGVLFDLGTADEGQFRAHPSSFALPDRVSWNERGGKSIYRRAGWRAFLGTAVTPGGFRVLCVPVPLPDIGAENWAEL